MNKSYSRDIQVLGHILKNQMNIRDTVKRLGCDFSQAGSKSIVNDKLAFDKRKKHKYPPRLFSR